MPSSRPHRPPCRHCRPSLLDRFRFARHRLLSPPEQLLIPQRASIFPRQRLDLLHHSFDDVSALASDFRRTRQRFRLAARQPHIENGNADFTQPLADQLAETLVNLTIQEGPITGYMDVGERLQSVGGCPFDS